MTGRMPCHCLLHCLAIALVAMLTDCIMAATHVLKNWLYRVYATPCMRTTFARGTPVSEQQCQAVLCSPADNCL
jgi:hypothetical protein